MKKEKTKKKHKHPRHPVATVFSACSMCLLVLLVVVCVPLTVPRFFGVHIYSVVSGSMEPGIPVGSAIYVQAVEPEIVEEGDVIAFYSGTSVIAHRVVRNQTVEGEFTTKGDANEQEDMNPVRYGELIGRVSCHYPVLGLLLEAYTSTLGKVYLICFAACGAMLNMLAGRLRNR